MISLEALKEYQNTLDTIYEAGQKAIRRNNELQHQLKILEKQISENLSNCFVELSENIHVSFNCTYNLSVLDKYDILLTIFRVGNGHTIKLTLSEIQALYKFLNQFEINKS